MNNGTRYPKAIGVRIPDHLLEWLKRKAGKEQRSLGWIVRRCIEESKRRGAR